MTWLSRFASRAPLAGGPSTAKRVTSFGSGRAALAVPLLWLGVSLLGAACVLPQDTRVIDTAAPDRNLPPFLLEQNATPARSVSIGNGPTCSLSFSVPAADPNVDDLLVEEWYVDYPSNATPFRRDVIYPSGQFFRGSPASWSISPASPGSPLGAPGLHIVEVLVSDGDLVNRLPQPRTFGDGGTDATYAVTYVWIVSVQTTNCP